MSLFNSFWMLSFFFSNELTSETFQILLVVLFASLLLCFQIVPLQCLRKQIIASCAPSFPQSFFFFFFFYGGITWKWIHCCSFFKGTRSFFICSRKWRQSLWPWNSLSFLFINLTNIPGFSSAFAQLHEPCVLGAFTSQGLSSARKFPSKALSYRRPCCAVHSHFQIISCSLYFSFLCEKNVQSTVCLTRRASVWVNQRLCQKPQQGKRGLITGSSVTKEEDIFLVSPASVMTD